MAKRLPPVHTGEFLLEEFLGPRGISQYLLAKTSRFLLAGSKKSSTARGRSPRTQRCGWLGSSGPF